MNKDKKILTSAVKEAGEHAQAKVVWVMQPLLEQMAQAFASYVGMQSLDSAGKPLLVSAMKNALQTYTSNEDNERVAIAAFVNSLLSNSRDVFSQQIVVETNRGDIVWSPFASGLTEFLDAHPDATITSKRIECTIPESITKTFMMTKIIPSTLLDQSSLAELFNTPELMV